MVIPQVFCPVAAVSVKARIKVITKSLVFGSMALSTFREFLPIVLQLVDGFALLLA